MDELFEERTDLSALNNAVTKLKGSIGQVIVGQPALVELLIATLLANGHALIEGVPGTAKTLTAKLFARSIDAAFSRIQFTPDLMPSDVIGTSVFNQQRSAFEFRRGPVFGNIVLVDEINRAPAKTQSALFEVMEEGQVTVDGTTYPMSQPFMVIATQNPVEHEGTYRLPEAQLDRFLVKIEIGYPSLDEESAILARQHQQYAAKQVEGITPVLSADEIATCREIVKKLHVEDAVLGFVARIVHETRNTKSLVLGASPRASLAVLNMAKALAAISGRDFVTPEDIKAVVAPVLRHRIILAPDKEMEGARPDDILKEILNKIEVPR